MPVLASGELRAGQAIAGQLAKNSKIYFKGAMYSLSSEGRLVKFSTGYTRGRILDFFQFSDNAVSASEIDDFVRLFQNEKKITQTQIKEILNETDEVKRVAKFKEVIKGRNQGLKGTDNLIDDILETSRYFDDNVLDISDVGLANWKTFQNRVATQLKTLYPNNKVGYQIFLDVTYIDDAGKTVTKTIIPDDLIQIETNGIMKYKVIDAKTSIRNNLVNMNDLTGTCTVNQKEIYPLIDNLASGRIVKVEMRGDAATRVFGDVIGETGKIEVQLEQGVDFWINSSSTDFTKYMVRQRIK